MTEELILVNIIDAVCQSMDFKFDGSKMPINFQPGTGNQVTKMLTQYDESDTYRHKKYPLIAMVLPAKIIWNTVGYPIARIERLVIATLNETQESVLQRYQPGGTFHSILYPCRTEFFRRLSYHKMVGTQDIFKFTEQDRPADIPVGSGVRDYIDSIEILNLEFNLNQIKIC